MRLILDTHVLIWAVSDASRLSAAALAAFQNPANRLYLSVASVWEVAIKVGNGKLTLSAPYRPWIETAVQKFSLNELPVTIDYTDAVSRLPHHHRDPFDRLIIAQALVEQVPVISADTKFDAYGVTRIWA